MENKSGSFLIVTAVCMLLCVSVCTAQNTGKFWHVTDFHYDHTYWSSMLSCNKVVRPSRYGDYWCDSPWELITKAMGAYMVRYDEDVDFLLWTGDTVAHIKDDNLSISINMDVMSNITEALKTHFPNKTVYATFGNHDYYPSDQFPDFNNIIYNRTAGMWEDWIQDADQLDNFRKGGYYTLKTQHGQRIVGLNTNLYYTSDKETPGIKDPSDQLQWLRSVLQKSKTDGEKVIITAHIPPGIHTPTRELWFHDEFIDPVNGVLKDFADVIVGLHFGHDHHDGFKIIYDSQGKAAAPLFVAPSVTPWRYKLPSGETGPPHNPSVRLVTYDRRTGKHLNIEQLMLDLVAANSADSANFTLLYNFTQHYNVPDISAASLETLVTRMANGPEGDKLLDDYFRFTTGGANQGDRTCDRTCKSRFLCGFRHYTFAEFDACVEGYVGSAVSISASGLLITVLLALLTLMGN